MQVFVAKSVWSASHDTQYFTQGLEVHHDRVFETTGLYGESRLIYRERANLAVVTEFQFDDMLFAEDIVYLRGLLYIGSWREKKIVIWDVAKKKIVRSYDYDREGWGICHDGRHFWTSDGTSQLIQRDEVFRPTGQTAHAHYGDRPVAGLNCLAWTSHGTIYSNVYGSDIILEIDPASGQVVSLVDARSLRESEPQVSDVLNGLAWDPARSAWIVTGKWWSRIHAVTLKESSASHVGLGELIESVPQSIYDLHDVSIQENL